MPAREMTARNPNSASYDVGYGKPPRHTQFRKGQSGNPGGRPRRPEVERMKELTLYEAYRTVMVRDDNGVAWPVPALVTVLRSQIKRAADGNVQAQRAFLGMVRAMEKEEAYKAFLAEIEGREYRPPGADNGEEMDDDEIEDDGKIEDDADIDDADIDGADLDEGEEETEGDEEIADGAPPQMTVQPDAAEPVAAPPETSAPPRPRPRLTRPDLANGPAGESRDAAAKRPATDGAAPRPAERRHPGAAGPCDTPGTSRAPWRRRRPDAAASGGRSPAGRSPAGRSAKIP
jgi:hypothetical protein